MSEATPQRVWLEIEYPTPEKDKHLEIGSPQYEDRQLWLGDHRAYLFDKLLRKLGHLPEYKGKVVFWHHTKGRYCITVDEAGGFMEMADNGHWFNLDYFAVDK